MSIDNQDLYDRVKAYADTVYKKPSAYKSGFIVKTYKEHGGTYSDVKGKKPLKQWFQERWMDVGDKSYPVYRPTVKVNKSTPLTVSEIDPDNLKEQIELKQKIKGKQNLPPFKPILQESPRKGKRFRLVLPNKTIDFGQEGGQTYIDHGDKVKRANYLKRHAVRENWTELNPGSASAWVLWGPSTDIQKNLKLYLSQMKNF
jgi:hypothetical protein